MNPIRVLLRQLWMYSNKKYLVVLYLSMSLISKAFFLAEPLIVGHVLNTIQTLGLTQESFPKIMLWLLLLVLVPLVGGLFHWPSRMIELSNAYVVQANFKKHLLKGTLDLPLSWHSERHSGDTIDKIEKGTAGLKSFAESSYALFNIFISIPVSLIIIGYFYFPAVFVALALGLVMILVVVAMDSRIMERLRSINRQENVISGRVYDAISNVTTIVILRIERIVHSSLAQQLFGPYPDVKKNTILSETKWAFIGVFNGLMIASILCLYIFSAYKSNEAIMVGTIFVLYGYSQQVQNRIFEFTWRYSQTVHQHTMVQNALELSDQFVEKEHGKKARIGHWLKLEIQNVTFSYDVDGTRLHLDSVSLDLTRGERVALIGSSGSGKTTFLKVFRELYFAKADIFVDKRKVQGFSSFAEDVSLIPQDPEIFNTTIKENITCGLEYSQKEIDEYVRLACADEFIDALPHKYESSINEKGVNLSGGQKQRLALARGLLASKDKEFVLMDEPTSSVDSKNELAIYKNVFAKFKEKTIISSIHRLHLLPLFDIIYYFDDGKIIAQGSFDELLKNSKEFQALYKKYQSQSVKRIKSNASTVS